MKAVIVTEHRGLEGVAVQELAPPAAGEGELVVRLESAGINPVDWKLLSGRIPLPARFPYVMGWDLAGEVVSKGHAASRFEIGDRVYGYVRRPVLSHGTFAEQVAVPECYLAKAPKALSAEARGAVPLAGLTALQGLEIGGLREGQTVLILGASGGVGTFVVQIARNLGARVVALARPRHHEHLRSLGADLCLDPDSDWVGAARAREPELVFDGVGGEVATHALSALRPGGRAVSITGTTSADPAIQVTGFLVEPHVPRLEQLARWADAGRLSVPVTAFPLDQALDALRRSVDGGVAGKLVLTP